jgi:hypothetical protein
MDTAAPQSWICPTCGDQVAAPFCATCGEQPSHPRDLTLTGLLRQVAEIFTNIDGRVLRSFRMLLRYPGMLTVAYAQGQRKPYIGPFQIFILANVLFFAVQSFTDLRIFSTPLRMHMHDLDWKDLAQTLVNARLQKTGVALDLYTPVFDQAVAVNAKSLIGLMVLPFAVFPAILFWNARKPFAVHVVFGLHFYAFLLLLFMATALGVSVVSRAFGGPGLNNPAIDAPLSLGVVMACAVYLYAAMGRVYEARGVLRGVKAMLLAVAVAYIFLGYRFMLLLITLYTT